MGGKRILSEAQVEEMAALRERGKSAGQIAEYFAKQGVKVSEGAIHWQCLRVGADAPMRLRGKSTQPSAPYQRGNHIVRPFTAEDDALLRVLDMQGFKLSVIARRMGRGPNSIRGRLLTLARLDAREEDKAAAA